MRAVLGINAANRHDPTTLLKGSSGAQSSTSWTHRLGERLCRSRTSDVSSLRIRGRSKEAAHQSFGQRLKKVGLQLDSTMRLVSYSGQTTRRSILHP